VTESNTPPDVKAHLPAADRIVDPLPWRLGLSEAQRKRSRGRVSALAHQVAALLAAGWTDQEIRVPGVGRTNEPLYGTGQCQDRTADRHRPVTNQSPLGSAALAAWSHSTGAGAPPPTRSGSR
jgi:hypothetical protein